MQYIEMTIEEAFKRCNKNNKVLVAIQDLGKEDCDIVFVKKEEETRTYHKYSFNGNDDESDIKAGWFSDEAKHDLALLKKEYRLLVKKYHPDNSDKDTTIIMQQIMTERADILSSIS